MEICPKCHQTMTWYMNYNYGMPYNGYHCHYCGYDTMEDSHTTYTSETISTINQPKPIIQMNVVNVSDDSINKIADAVVQKLRAEQTEPQTDGYIKGEDFLKIFDEPQTECDHKCIQTEVGCEKTDCAWK